MIDHLFTYGTLAPGKVNHHVLESIPGTWRPATLRGQLIQEGWGAELGSPGIVPDASREEVTGFLFSFDASPEHWIMLDEFEGDSYRRVQVDVEVEGAGTVLAYVYALNRSN
ncbi:MAG: gamma-glutamylcyclotransferase family protein [Pseudomonadota bacterium]